jgi:hypothetical protein
MWERIGESLKNSVQHLPICKYMVLAPIGAAPYNV